MSSSSYSSEFSKESTLLPSASVSGCQEMDVVDFLESREVRRPFAAVLQSEGVSVPDSTQGYSLQFADMGIAWKDSSHSWEFPEEGGVKVAHCKHVCWLSMDGEMKDVKKGVYIPIIRLKLPRNIRNLRITFLFCAEARQGEVSMDGMPGTGKPKPAEITYPLLLDLSWASSASPGSKYAIYDVAERSRINDGWSDMMLGPIELSETGNVTFKCGGPNPCGCGDLWFDKVQLVPVHHLSKTSKEALFSVYEEEKPTLLSSLPPHLISKIAQAEVPLKLEMRKFSNRITVELL